MARTWYATLEARERRLRAAYDELKVIQHRGTKGAQVEHLLRSFLREYLPQQYGIGDGEIVCVQDDAPSPQCDIVIYDRFLSPRLLVGALPTNVCPELSCTALDIPLEGRVDSGKT